MSDEQLYVVVGDVLVGILEEDHEALLSFSHVGVLVIGEHLNEDNEEVKAVGLLRQLVAKLCVIVLGVIVHQVIKLDDACDKLRPILAAHAMKTSQHDG